MNKTSAEQVDKASGQTNPRVKRTTTMNYIDKKHVTTTTTMLATGQIKKCIGHQRVVIAVTDTTHLAKNGLNRCDNWMVGYLITECQVPRFLSSEPLHRTSVAGVIATKFN